MRQEQDYSAHWLARCLNCILIVSLIGSVGVVSVFASKESASESEKRDLATMPKLTLQSFFSGDFARDFDLYYADTFPGRSGLIAANASIEHMRGFTLDDIRVHQGTQEAPPPVTSQTPQSPAPPKPNTSQTDASRNDSAASGEQIGASFVYKGMALPIFTSNAPAGTRYAKVVSDYSEALGDDVQVYNLIIPSSIEFYLPHKYQSVTTPQKANIQSIYDQMPESVITVDAHTPISRNTDEYLYFRTDHHWTARGAYYAYTAFAKAAGFESIPLADFEKKTLPKSFLGSLYYQTNDQSLTKNPDVLEYFVPKTPAYSNQYRVNNPYYPMKTTVFAEYATGSNSYCVFLHGDLPLTHIVTENKNGRSIAIVKESFGNAFVPFLIDHYQDIYVVDQRYFQLGLVEFIKANQIDELLFINNIFAAQTDIRINEIRRLMYQQNFVPSAQPEPTESEEQADPDEANEQTEQPTDTQTVPEQPSPEEPTEEPPVQEPTEEQKPAKKESKEVDIDINDPAMKEFVYIPPDYQDKPSSKKEDELKPGVSKKEGDDSSTFTYKNN